MAGSFSSTSSVLHIQTGLNVPIIDMSNPHFPSTQAECEINHVYWKFCAELFSSVFLPRNLTNENYISKSDSGLKTILSIYTRCVATRGSDFRPGYSIKANNQVCRRISCCSFLFILPSTRNLCARMRSIRLSAKKSSLFW